jgi:hypothetical protein
LKGGRGVAVVIQEVERQVKVWRINHVTDAISVVFTPLQECANLSHKFSSLLFLQLLEFLLVVVEELEKVVDIRQDVCHIRILGHHGKADDGSRSGSGSGSKAWDGMVCRRIRRRRI